MIGGIVLSVVFWTWLCCVCCEEEYGYENSITDTVVSDKIEVNNNNIE